MGIDAGSALTEKCLGPAVQKAFVEIQGMGAA